MSHQIVTPRSVVVIDALVDGVLRREGLNGSGEAGFEPTRSIEVECFNAGGNSLLKLPVRLCIPPLARKIEAPCRGADAALTVNRPVLSAVAMGGLRRSDIHQGKFPHTIGLALGLATVREVGSPAANRTQYAEFMRLLIYQ